MAINAHTWQFSSRFRRNAFGWQSETPIQRIKEALTEIKQAAHADPALAAEDAVLLLEKLSPALQQVDSSSGALGSAVNRAIESLAPIIGKAEVDRTVRRRWLERLWRNHRGRCAGCVLGGDRRGPCQGANSPIPSTLKCQRGRSWRKSSCIICRANSFSTATPRLLPVQGMPSHRRINLISVSSGTDAVKRTDRPPNQCLSGEC